MKLVWNSPKTTEIVKVHFLRFFVSTPLTWTRHHITSSRKRDFQSALYWWRQKAQGRGTKGAKGVPNALSLKGTWEQQCAGWRRRSSNKRPGQRPHGLENEFNNVQGKGAKGREKSESERNRTTMVTMSCIGNVFNLSRIFQAVLWLALPLCSTLRYRTRLA